MPWCPEDDDEDHDARPRSRPHDSPQESCMNQFDSASKCMASPGGLILKIPTIIVQKLILFYSNYLKQEFLCSLIEFFTLTWSF